MLKINDGSWGYQDIGGGYMHITNETGFSAIRRGCVIMDHATATIYTRSTQGAFFWSNGDLYQSPIRLLDQDNSIDGPDPMSDIVIGASIRCVKD